MRKVQNYADYHQILYLTLKYIHDHESKEIFQLFLSYYTTKLLNIYKTLSDSQKIYFAQASYEFIQKMYKTLHVRVNPQLEQVVELYASSMISHWKFVKLKFYKGLATLCEPQVSVALFEMVRYPNFSLKILGIPVISFSKGMQSDRRKLCVFGFPILHPFFRKNKSIFDKEMIASQIAKTQENVLQMSDNEKVNAGRISAIPAASRKIGVKNADGDLDTEACIVIQNTIDYVPKVSIIIPVYNAAKYLFQCLNSVICQTLKEIEIICVDDGSTDDSLNILKRYAEIDRRITVLTQRNYHAGVARNAGLVVATGEYIHFLDSDDWVDGDTYQKLYSLIVKKGVPLLKFRSYAYDNNSNRIANSYFTNMGAVKSGWFNSYLSFHKNTKILLNVSDAPWSGIYNRKFLDDLNIRFDNLLCANDTSFFYRCIINAKRIYLAKNRFVYYRINSATSLVGIRAYHFDCQIKQFFNICKIIQNIDASRQLLVRKHLIHALFYRYDLYLKNPRLDWITKEQLHLDFAKVIKQINRDEIDSEYLHYHTALSSPILVSIIVPVYNAEKYLTQCLDSIVNQTLREIEIICINDCSTDNSLSILETYAKKDKRIIIINNDKNSGAPGVVKNIGIRHAKGMYIGFVDSDDWVDQDYFESLYNTAIVNNAEMAAAIHFARFHDSYEKRFIYPVDDKTILSSLEDRKILIQLAGSNWTKLYQTNFLKKYNLMCWEKRCVSEDNYLSILAMLLTNKIAIAAHVTYYYRKTDGSLTKQKRTDKDFHVFDVYLAIDSFIKKMPLSRKKKSRMLSLIDERKKIDFKWFKNRIDDECLDSFKSKLKNVFPKIYKSVFQSKELIVSLTSYPARIKTVHRTIESLFNQTMSANKVILWLAPEQFPQKEKDLPAELLALKEKGLIIDWYHDIKSYKKLIPTLKKYPEAIIVTADDDLIYDKNWLMLLFDSYLKHPKFIHCHRITRLNSKFKIVSRNFYLNGSGGYYPGLCKANAFNKLCGGAGTLFPPHCFTKEVLNESVFMNLASTSDDIWFWLMGLLNSYKVKVVPNNIFELCYIPNTQVCGLFHTNDTQTHKVFYTHLHNILNYYPQLQKIFAKDSVKNTNILNKKLGKACVKVRKKSLEMWYYGLTKQQLNLEAPKTFNEKIQWLKLYDSTPIKTRLADKYLVRDWIKEKIGEEYLIPLLGVYDRFDDIDFDALPNQFVIKCNHGCAYNIIVKDKNKLDLQEVKTKLDGWLSENYAFRYGFELHYRDIPPKILIEKYMDDGTGDLRDYKYTCFNGKPEFIWIDSDRHSLHKRNLYDLNWHQLNCKVNSRYDTFPSPSRPVYLEEMNKLAAILSEGFAYVRVDFYIIDEKIYFGEMTFTSSSGTEDIVPPSFEEHLSSLIKLPKLAYNIDTGKYYKLPK